MKPGDMHQALSGSGKAAAIAKRLNQHAVFLMLNCNHLMGLEHAELVEHMSGMEEACI